MNDFTLPAGHVPFAVNPALRNATTYPFQRLAHARALAGAAPGGLIDLGVGEPQEETPAFIRQALIDGLTPQSPYPTAIGQPALREAIAGWVRQRYGARLDPARQIIPTLGAKEVVYSLAQGFTDREGYSLTFAADELPVRTFLNSIDFFVYHQHPQAYDAFGRAVLEALATGCVAILPKVMQATFGDAALYATPEQTMPLVRRYYADPARYRAQSALAVRRVRERFSRESYAAQVAALLGES